MEIEAPYRRVAIRLPSPLLSRLHDFCHLYLRKCVNWTKTVLQAKTNFRQRARDFVTRANVEIQSGDDSRLRYAALEIRMAMESITYDRAQAFKEEIPPELYATWQPRKLMGYLVSLVPDADLDSSISFGLEKTPGKPADKMHSLGQETVFKFRDLKKHYDAFGNYLHSPTAEQIQNNKDVDFAKLRKRCAGVIELLEKALASPVFNSTFGVFATLSCLRCDFQIKKRINEPNGSAPMSADCFECHAKYKIRPAGNDQYEWIPEQVPIKCVSDECGQTNYVWADQIVPDQVIICASCDSKLRIGLAIFPEEPEKEKGEDQSVD